MPAKKGSSMHQKALYEAYNKNGTKANNKAIKLERHQKNNPNDKQEVGLVPDYTSKKPTPYDFGASRVKQTLLKSRASK